MSEQMKDAQRLQVLISRLPKPDDETDYHDHILNLFATHEPFRDLCGELASILMEGSKALRIAAVTSVVALNDLVSGCSSEDMFKEEGGAE